MKKAVIIGHFGIGYNCTDGQTIKTKNIYDALSKLYDREQIQPIDTHGSIASLIKAPFILLKAFYQFDNIIILPAHRGVRVYVPIIWIYKKLFHNVRVHYVVIGGWLPSLLEKKGILRRAIKSIDYIYVETDTMKTSLDSLRIRSVVMPNFRVIKMSSASNQVSFGDETLHLCTFSRVMKQKGIEDAINVVAAINKKENVDSCSLDIYGPIDPDETEWFEELMAGQPEYIKYMGIVSQEHIVDTLSRYYALLFPTRFYTEGIPGTIIDAYASGLPVVVSKWQSYKDIVEENITGFAYEFGNVDEFESITNHIVKNPLLINGMRENCRQYAGRFSADEVIKILDERIKKKFMWKKKTKILFILYKLFASWLPISQRSNLAKSWRTFFAKRIIKQCGENVNIERGAIFTPELSIGNNSGIGIDCEVYGPVTIGCDVMMGPEVVIYTSDHLHSISSEPFWRQGSDISEVTIGNNVWIGRRAMFMAGSSVGNNVVVAAGAVVTKHFGNNVVIGGVPAKIIRRIEREEMLCEESIMYR